MSHPSPSQSSAEVRDPCQGLAIAPVSHHPWRVLLLSGCRETLAVLVEDRRGSWSCQSGVGAALLCSMASMARFTFGYGQVFAISCSAQLAYVRRAREHVSSTQGGESRVETELNLRICQDFFFFFSFFLTYVSSFHWGCWTFMTKEILRYTAGLSPPSGRRGGASEPPWLLRRPASAAIGSP